MKRDVFNALADPTRRSILLSLTAEPQHLNSIAEGFNITRQAVSLHVKYLEECGVIIIEKKGRQRYCNLQAQKLIEIADWLKPFQQLWENRFSALDDTLKKLQANK